MKSMQDLVGFSLSQVGTGNAAWLLSVLPQVKDHPEFSVWKQAAEEAMIEVKRQDEIYASKRAAATALLPLVEEARLRIYGVVFPEYVSAGDNLRRFCSADRMIDKLLSGMSPEEAIRDAFAACAEFERGGEGWSRMSTCGNNDD